MNVPINHFSKEIQNTLVTAELNYDIWRIYKEKKHREKFTDVMNEYVAFFSTSIHAHFVALIAALYQLYETRSN